MYEWFESARVAICLLFLSAASIHDIKTREVPNITWLLFAPIGLVLTLISLALNGWSQTTILAWLVTAAVTVGLSTALFHLGLFGGADAKALMCLAAAMPTQPNITSIKPLLSSFMGSHYMLQLPPPISTFNNAVLTASLLIIAISIRNLADLARHGRRIFEGLEKTSLTKKFFTFLTGYRVDAQKLRSGGHHYIILEEFSRGEDGSIKRSLKLLPRLNMSGENSSETNLPAEFNGKIWVTMGLPFIVFITMGFAAAIFIGDLILMLMGSILPHT
ncbi:MAG: A24 family peptidase C-terminal domain-containing protein [Candidatus Bathyarchaeia archaeon]